MNQINIFKHSGPFTPLLSSDAIQAAVMSLKPGESSSEKIENEHPRAEQWLFVVSGTGVAKVGKQRVNLKAGVLLLIPKNAPHQITCKGRVPLLTLNFYSPPAYTPAGEVKASVARSS